MTTPRTLALVTRLRALYPAFKPEWWQRDVRCPTCHAHPLGCWCPGFPKWKEYGEPRYIGPPDLLDPKCLAELFDVCDLLCETFFKGTWPEISEALLAAAEAALGAGEEVAGG